MITSLRNIFFILLVVCCLPLYPAEHDHGAPEHEHEHEVSETHADVQQPHQQEKAVVEPHEQQVQHEGQKVEHTPQQQQPQPAPNLDEDVEITGINTVDLKEPQGNWLFKRIWFERAEREYEKAVALSQLVMDSRMDFFQRRSSLDKDVLDPFYLSVGLGQGELQEIVDALTKKIEVEREREGDLDAQEREFLDTLQKQKELLRQLSLDITFINELDHKIDEDLHVLMEQINLIRNYENEAWQNFKEISRTLSDKRAREIFIEMKNTVGNIAQVYKYIGSEFHDYFNQQIDIIYKKIDLVKAAIQELKNKGIDLKTHFEQLVVQREAEERGEVPVVEQEEQEEEPEVQPGFFTSYIVNPMSAVGSGILAGGKMVWDGFVYVISWPVKKIMGLWQTPQQVDEDVDYQFLESTNEQELPETDEHDFIADEHEGDVSEQEEEINHDHEPEHDHNHESEHEHDETHAHKDEADLDVLMAPTPAPALGLQPTTH